MPNQRRLALKSKIFSLLPSMTGTLVNPEFYGETWKVSDDDQKCAEISSPTTENCENKVRNPPPPSFSRATAATFNLILNWDLQKSLCKNALLGAAILDCQRLVDLDAFVDICVKDTCNSASDLLSLCSTISEYSHQCAHAGGRPGAWRTPELCGKQSSRTFSLFIS